MIYYRTDFLIFLKLFLLPINKKRHKFNVLLLTFLSYASYHMARKPTSVVKNVLHQNCTNLTPDEGVNITGIEDTWCSWSPFGECTCIIYYFE
jgi:OPA family glycerol-3-phosphate transporter-like MFS transporter 1/2